MTGLDLTLDIKMNEAEYQQKFQEFCFDIKYTKD